MFKRAPENRPADDGYHPWTTYIDARQEARRRGDHKVGTEHLVLALLMEPPLAAALGVDLQAARAALEALDRDALAAVGVEIGGTPLTLADEAAPSVSTAETPAVTGAGAPSLAGAQAERRARRPTMKNVWEGRLPLTPAAKTLLRDNSKEMRRFGGRHPGPGRILAALLQLDRPDPAAELFARLGVDRAAARDRLAGL